MIFIRHHKKHKKSACMAAMCLMLFSCASPNPDAVMVTHMGVKAYGDTTSIPVRLGDTVYIMSQRLGVDMRALIDQNNLKPPYTIYPGQRLRVPTPPTIQVQTGDTLYSVAHAYNADQSEIVRLNGLKPPYRLAQGQQLKLPSVPVSSSTIVATSKNAVSVLVDDPVYEKGAISMASSRDIVDSKPTGMATTTVQKTPESSVKSEKAAAPVISQLPAPGALKPEDAKLASLPPAKTVTTPAATTSASVKPNATNTTTRAQNVSGVAPRFSWPVNGSILSDFGPKAGGRHNDGLNIGAPSGSPVRAAAAGEVVYSGDKVAGFGNLILIRHSGGYSTAYAHVQKPLISRGDKIAAGQAIAGVGKTGNVSTPQLHFEIRKGTKPVNPKTYLP